MSDYRMDRLFRLFSFPPFVNLSGLFEDKGGKSGVCNRPVISCRYPIFHPLLTLLTLPLFAIDISWLYTMQTNHTPSLPTVKRSPTFWFDKGDFYLQASPHFIRIRSLLTPFQKLRNTIYCVYSSSLALSCDFFSGMFDGSTMQHGTGLFQMVANSENSPCIIPSITASNSELEAFLDLVFGM